MKTRTLIGSLAVAVVIGAAVWVYREDRKAKRAALEFEEQVRTALHSVEDPDEVAQLLQQERIKEMLAAVLADWDDPAFGAFCERQFGSQTRTPGRPE